MTQDLLVQCLLLLKHYAFSKSCPMMSLISEEIAMVAGNLLFYILRAFCVYHSLYIGMAGSSVVHRKYLANGT